MAKYINREDLNFLNDFRIDSGKYAGLRLDEVFDKLATADVIERKEIRKLEAKIFNATTDKYFMPIESLSCDEIIEIIKEWEGECNGKSEQ